jgi:hypothetical protein
MVPVNESQLEKIRNDFERFKLAGNSDFKAAYLATSENGFIHSAYTVFDNDNGRKMIALKNDADCFVCMHQVEIKVPVVITKQSFIFGIE